MSHVSNESMYTKRLVTGFASSFLCTMIVFIVVTNHWISGQTATVVFILAMAGLQAGLQAKYFLHFDEESRPRWQLHSFWFTVFMVLVIVVGSIWVITNMNYNMGMSPQQMEEYMLKQNKKGF